MSGTDTPFILVPPTPPTAIVSGELRAFTAEPSTDLQNFEHLWTPPEPEIEVTSVEGQTRTIAAPDPVGIEAFEGPPLGVEWYPPRDVIKILDRRQIRLNQLQSYACSYFSLLNSAKATKGHAPTYQEGIDGYNLAQQLDEWAGQEPTYYGSSTNGALKAGRQRGLVRGWQWIPRAEHCIASVMFGTAPMWPSVWTSGMVYPNRSHIMSPYGSSYGGHLVSIFAWIGPMNLVGIDNSWGAWGNDGVAYMPLPEFVAKWNQWRESAIPTFA